MANAAIQSMKGTLFLSTVTIALCISTFATSDDYRIVSANAVNLKPLRMLVDETIGTNGTWSRTRTKSDTLKLLSLRERTRARKRCANETELLRYEWIPHTAGAVDVDSLLAFAEAKLRIHSPTLWVGDSILEQFYESFVDLTQQRSAHIFAKNFILVEPYSLQPVSAAAFDACSENANDCPQGTNEFIIHNQLNTTPHLSYHRDMKYFSWGKNLTQSKFKTLLLNTGHHWWKETSSKSRGFGYNVDAFDKYPHMVAGVAKFLEKENFHGNAIFVTSPPGYPNCGPELLPNTLPHSWENRYQWQRVPPLEKYWQTTFEALAPNVKFSIMNITHMSVLRGDAHRRSDCLHFCSVGVPDEWSLYLLQYLKHLQEHQERKKE